MASSSIITLPLIPINPHSISFIDLLLPPILIAIAIIIYDFQSHPNSSNYSSHRFKNHTKHSRLLPSKSTHQFKYDLIQFGLDLDHLESGHLNVPYLFKFITPQQHHPLYYFNPSSWLNLIQIFSISPSSYHPINNKINNPSSIKIPLLDQLRDRFGILDAHDQIGKVYLLSMPTYLGFTPINPLSVYFCYQKPTNPNQTHHPPLKYVVLDVQNTFSERHSYLLTVGLNESSDPPSGFQHVWTIPRAFHVSPFNDRSGFYKVSISDPFLNSQFNANSGNTEVKVNVEIVLLTATGQKKFFASLRGTGTPLTKSELLYTWIKFPFILFMTTSRILYQSLILHLGKPRLDVYPKPDPFYSQDHDSKGPNPVQSGAHVGATGWQEPEWCSRWSKQIILDYLTQRVDQIAKAASQSITHSPERSFESKHDPNKELTSIGSFEHLTNDQVETKAIEESSSSSSKDEEEETDNQVPTPSSQILSIILKPADQTQEIIKISPDSLGEQDSNMSAEDLIIQYGSAGFFKDLILFPTPSLAQVICDESEASWKVSSVKTFDKVFENPSVPQFGNSLPTRTTDQSPRPIEAHSLPSLSSFLLSCINKSRSSYLDWQLSFITHEERNLGQLKNRCSWFPPPNFLSINDVDDDNGSKPRGRIEIDSNPIELKLKKSNVTLLKILLILTYTSWTEKYNYFIFSRIFMFRFVHNFQPWFLLKRAIFNKNHIPLTS